MSEVFARVERERNLLNSNLIEFENLLLNPCGISPNTATDRPCSFLGINNSASSVTGHNKVPSLVSSSSQLGVSAEQGPNTREKIQEVHGDTSIWMKNWNIEPLNEMLDLLVHGSECRLQHCPYPNCPRLKGLFRHGIQCTTRASGGCVICKKMCYILQLHARACKESECHVPSCKVLKEDEGRLHQPFLTGTLQFDNVASYEARRQKQTWTRTRTRTRRQGQIYKKEKCQEVDGDTSIWSKDWNIGELNEMLDVLVHGSDCRLQHCPYRNCPRLKRLIRHGIQCRIRASGGCVVCKKMWYILQQHARVCKESECCVPSCKAMKEDRGEGDSRGTAN